MVLNLKEWEYLSNKRVFCFEVSSVFVIHSNLLCFVILPKTLHL